MASTITAKCIDCGKVREVRKGGWRPMPLRCQACSRKHVGSTSTFNGPRPKK